MINRLLYALIGATVSIALAYLSGIPIDTAMILMYLGGILGVEIGGE